MKTTPLYPRVADRSMRAQWEASGKPDAQSRARTVADGILSRPNPAVWDAALDARIRAEFPGLVAGDSAWRGA